MAGSSRRAAGKAVNATTTDTFAQSALNSLLGDLQQEIAAGSKIAIVAPGVTVFAPRTPETAVPSIVLGTATNTGGLNNLVKLSARNQPFFPADSNYDTQTYPAPIRAASVASDTAALNGRYISAERWNKPLLLPKKDPGSEAVSPTTDFVSPDWVLVARDGSNPTTWNNGLIDTGANPTAVVGRYTYAIYDEGGLLDASVAGYPSSVPPSQAAFKTSLAFADLTQLTDASGGQLLTQAQIDALIDWRNAHPLFSRQDLVNFLTQQLAISPASCATLQNALQYLGTFSRGLEQPSFIKTQSVDATDVLGYDATAPKLFAPASGGNNAGPGGSYSGLDAAINPSFLAVRIQTARTGGRFDGSDLVAGEPLVKKRFPLNRLAWLTFAGPISDGSQLNPTGNAEVAVLVTALKNTYGFTDTFLMQGTAVNIQSCFGLSWDASNSRWSYNMHNRDGSTGPICKLNYAPDSTDVLRANREADFFELLKASVNVGSLAKSGTVARTDENASKLLASYLSQYDDDSRVDNAIIQMGANIIDQFDLDGYATRIYFNDGSTASGKEFRGVENLPYLSRLTHALVKVKQTNPTIAGSTITDTGVGALLQCPELWNPHDYNTANLNQTAGVVGPTKFRIYAVSGTQGGNGAVSLRGLIRDQGGSGNLGHNHTQANVPKSPGYQSKYGFSFTQPETRNLTQANTELDFTVSRDATGLARFREPSVLFQSSSSGGYVDQSPALANYGTIGGNAAFFAGNGFKSDVGSGVNGIPPVQGQGYVGFYLGALPLYWSDSVASGAPYYWLDETVAYTPVDVHYYLQYQNGSGNWVTYDEKYRTLGGSGNYSENSTLSGGGDRSAAANGWKSFSYPRNASSVGNWDCSYAAMDPRTSRFGLMKLTGGNASTQYWTFPPYAADNSATATRTATASTVGFTNGWIDASKGIGLGLRSGTSDGTPFMCPVGVFPTSMGWNPGSVSATTSGQFVAMDNLTLGATAGNSVCRPGIFSQNNPFARRNNRALGDNGDSGVMDSSFVPLGVSNAAQFYTDADGVARRATGGLVPYNASSGIPATTDVGLPMTPANTNGVTRLDQSNSRPVILNRPFRTVGELAYTFAGTPWKNLNFTMPESGDSALLDVFCVNDTDDPNGLVAGKVNLNTRQAPVLQAIIAGAYKDEWNPGTSTVSGVLPAAIATGLVARTTSTAIGKGPLQNVSELVGRFVSKLDANADTTMSGVTASMKSTTISPRSYDGFSADLINNTVSPATGILLSDSNITIPRFADATMRALAASGQTRVWNLMIDLVAQTGQYPASASSLAAFAVAGEQRYWLHVAVDRYTGEVLAQSLEAVPEPSATLTNASVLENQSVGTPVGTLTAVGTDPTVAYTLALASGEGSDGNASFTVSGNQLQTAAVFHYLTQSSYNLRVRATDQTGASFDQELTITILPGPFTQWKLAYFADQANNPTVAADTADPDHDGLANLMEYALAKSPTSADNSGLSVQKTNGSFRMNYTRLSAATDITVHAYWTSNLKDAASWRTSGITETLLSDDGTLQQWQAAVPESFGPNVFMRLQVTNP